MPDELLAFFFVPLITITQSSVLAHVWYLYILTGQCHILTDLCKWLLGDPWIFLHGVGSKILHSCTYRFDHWTWVCTLSKSKRLVVYLYKVLHWSYDLSIINPQFNKHNNFLNNKHSQDQWQSHINKHGMTLPLGEEQASCELEMKLHHLCSGNY